MDIQVAESSQVLNHIDGALFTPRASLLQSRRVVRAMYVSRHFALAAPSQTTLVMGSSKGKRIEKSRPQRAACHLVL